MNHDELRKRLSICACTIVGLMIVTMIIGLVTTVSPMLVLGVNTLFFGIWLLIAGLGLRYVRKNL